MAAFVRSRDTWLVYASVGTFGWFFYVLGPSLNLLGDELNASALVMSLPMSAYALGSMLGGYLTPKFAERLGRGRTIRYASLLIAVMLVALTVSPTSLTTIAILGCVGTAATACVGLQASYFNDALGERSVTAVTESNVLAAVAGFFAPLTVGVLVTAGWGWRPAMIAAALALLAIELLRGDSRRFDGTELHHSERSARLPRDYWWAWALLIITAGTEFMVLLWSGPLLRDRAAMGSAAAAASLATFTGGLAVGRWLLSRLTHRFGSESLLRSAFLLPLLAFWGLWLSSTPAAMLGSLFVIGLGVGAHWPLAISRVVRAGGSDADRAAARSGYATGGAAMVLPLLLGSIADQIGIHQAFLVLPVWLALGVGLLYLKPLRTN